MTYLESLDASRDLITSGMAASNISGDGFKEALLIIKAIDKGRGRNNERRRTDIELEKEEVIDESKWGKCHCGAEIIMLPEKDVQTCHSCHGSIYRNGTPAAQKYLIGQLLNEADPIEFAASEYRCAMSRLDSVDVPTEKDGQTLSLVGRISELARIAGALAIESKQ